MSEVRNGSPIQKGIFIAFRAIRTNEADFLTLLRRVVEIQTKHSLHRNFKHSKKYI